MFTKLRDDAVTTTVSHMCSHTGKINCDLKESTSEVLFSTQRISGHDMRL